MSMRALKKAVRKSRDDFEVGTLVTWTASGRYQYAALKTPVGWYTTGSRRAVEYGFVKEIMTFEDILEVLSKGESADVRVVRPEDGERVTV